jgi:hypothetical protein
MIALSSERGFPAATLDGVIAIADSIEPASKAKRIFLFNLIPTSCAAT